MNKVYQFISDYRLPTERPFAEAVKEYGTRALIICAVTLSAMAASVLIALIIIAFEKGYGIVVIVVIIILYNIGKGGTSGGVRPPPSEPSESEKKSDERQAATPEREKVMIPARHNPPKQKEMVLRIDEPTKPPQRIERKMDNDD